MSQIGSGEHIISGARKFENIMPKLPKFGTGPTSRSQDIASVQRSQGEISGRMDMLESKVSEMMGAIGNLANLVGKLVDDVKDPQEKTDRKGK